MLATKLKLNLTPGTHMERNDSYNFSSEVSAHAIALTHTQNVREKVKESWKVQLSSAALA